MVLSDRTVYHSFFRTVPSDELLVSAVAAIMDTYEWRQLSVFTEEQPQFTEVRYYSSSVVLLCNIGIPLLLQLYQHLKKIQWEMSNITRVKSYCFGQKQLQNYSHFADDLAIVFVCNEI